MRFIELLCPAVGGDRWDQHSDLRHGHENNARAVDQPIAALLSDLKSRGLLDTTLVVWGGEFGRTPMAQGTDGRDHNPYGFTMWLAGGGIKGGTIYGATDDYGYHADRKQGRGPRPARHDAAPAGRRSQAADLPLRRPRHAADRRPRRGCPWNHRLRPRAQSFTRTCWTWFLSSQFSMISCSSVSSTSVMLAESSGETR